MTIERDTERYLKAVDYIRRSGLEKRITIIEADALLTEDAGIFSRTYDALFIDAAKGQYKRFFEKYAPTVDSGALSIAIICSCMVWYCSKIKKFHDAIAQ